MSAEPREFALLAHGRQIFEYVEEEHPRDEKGWWVEAGGGGEAWRTKEDDYVGPYRDGMTDAEFHEKHIRGEEWKQSLLAAESLGLVSDARKAEEAGVRYGILNAGQWHELPPDLYHVTTNAAAVERDGLKSRFELDQESGHGLGGGDNKSISFTTDAATAHAIADALREAHDVCDGSRTIAAMIEDARNGVGAPKPYLDKVLMLYGVGPNDIPEHLHEGTLPESLRYLLEGKATHWGDPKFSDYAMSKGKWEPAVQPPPRYGGTWVRVMGRDEALDQAFDFYKKFASARELAGGKMDPLFFGSDRKALARMDPTRDIAVLHFKPVKGAKGTAMSDSLKEWRTYTGKAVKLVGRVKR